MEAFATELWVNAHATKAITMVHAAINHANLLRKSLTGVVQWTSGVGHCVPQGFFLLDSVVMLLTVMVRQLTHSTTYKQQNAGNRVKDPTQMCNDNRETRLSWDIATMRIGGEVLTQRVANSAAGITLWLVFSDLTVTLCIA
jgi:hypothetical protein